MIEPALNSALGQYPSAQIARERHFDTSHLASGWLSWHGTYETIATPEVVAVWYANRLPGAEAHTAGQCQVLRQLQSFWHAQRAMTVQLCARRSGTAILVNEDVYLAP
jgi:hypothetical protein